MPSSSFQQALYRNVTEKNAQLEKRLENVIREEREAAEALKTENTWEFLRGVNLVGTISLVFAQVLTVKFRGELW